MRHSDLTKLIELTAGDTRLDVHDRLVLYQQAWYQIEGESSSSAVGVRRIAADLCISKNTVTKARRNLEDTGYLVRTTDPKQGARGQGYRVSFDPQDVIIDLSDRFAGH